MQVHSTYILSPSNSLKCPLGLLDAMSESAEGSVPSPTALLPLQEWLKLLASRGVDMRVAMGLAAKMQASPLLACAELIHYADTTATTRDNG